MRTLFLTALPLLAIGCGEPSITADGLESSWKESIGWPELDPDFEESIVTDPQAITGEFTASRYSGECYTTWAFEGDRTDCYDCEFAFYVSLDPIADTCGYGYTTRGTFFVNNGYVYFDYTRMASVDQIGNSLQWDSRDDDGGDEPYGYYEYYYDYYSTDYYGSATLLAR